ncbi:MAG: carboxypeptidase-like regulatory domain-containing protein [Armatimonadota bacterium]|nr:carboxypeptidase-like regulatory domain-containing protein [Armatimonadota bacterium]
MCDRWALGWLMGLVIIAVMTVGFGCGGDDGAGGVAPPTPVMGTATLAGTVVAASDPTLGVSDAVISVVDANRSGLSGAGGSYRIENLPAGTWSVQVTTPRSEHYGTANAEVPLNENETTTVHFAVLPLDVSVPEQILLDPTSATIDLNGQITYRTQLVSASSKALDSLEPTWVVTGGIGSMSPTGVFTAQSVGAGQVQAFSGSARRTSTVVVVSPRPPQINSFRLNPQILPATGGQVYISASIADGDGVRVQDAKVQVYAPGDRIIELDMQVSNPETAIACPGLVNCYRQASYNTTFAAPANDNQPTADGVQAPENYSARLLVRDRTGMTSTSEFVDFTVQGIDQPPPRPGL